MYLGMNTYLFEQAGVPILTALDHIAAAGFRYVEYAAYMSADPTVIGAPGRKAILARFRKHGLACSQLQLANVQDLASADEPARARTLEYMRNCAEFMMELGGRQMLIWYGGGTYDPDVPREQSWMCSVDSLRQFADWCAPLRLLIDIELEPTTYAILNSTERMAKMIEDLDVANVNSNIDIGHFYLNREGPRTIDKLARRMLHVHISETQGFEHTNSIIGTGTVPYRPYIDKVLELGIEANCRTAGVPCVAGIEMGSPSIPIDDPKRWMMESLDYIHTVLPDLGLGRDHP